MRAYAYVKGSEAHFHPVHESILKQAGYEIAFTSISRANGSGTNPFRLGRYNVEPYPVADVRPRALGRVRPDLAEGHRRRHPRAAAVQPGARHIDAVGASVKVVEYDPSRRADVADLMGRVWGERPGRGRARLVLRAQPGAAGLGAARRGGRQDGRRRRRSASCGCRSAARRVEVGMPLRVATDPAYRGRGIFGELEAAERGAGARARRPAAAHRPERRVGAGLPEPARLDGAAAAARLGAAAARAPAAARAAPSSGFGPGRSDSPGRRATACCATPTGSTGASPTRRRRYTLLEGDGYAVAGRRGRARRRRRGRGRAPRRRRRRGRRAASRSPPRRRGSTGAMSARGYVPTHRTFTVLGKSLDPGQADPGAARTSSSATSTSCEQASSSSRRSSTPRTRSSERSSASSARSPRGSTRSPCSPTSAVDGALPDELPRPGVRRRLEARARPRSSRAACDASSRRSRSPSSRTASRCYAILAAPARRGRAASRCCSGSPTGSAAGRSSSPSGSRPRC